MGSYHSLHLIAGGVHTPKEQDAIRKFVSRWGWDEGDHMEAINDHVWSFWFKGTASCAPGWDGYDKSFAQEVAEFDFGWASVIIVGQDEHDEEWSVIGRKKEGFDEKFVVECPRCLRMLEQP